MINFTSFLLISFIVVQHTNEHPVSISQTNYDSQRAAGVLTPERKPAHSVPEDFYGEDVNLQKGEGEDDGAETGEQDLQELSPDTADTMRKINPLTIADQVSQMFRKGSQKANIANKSGVGFRSQNSMGLRGEDTHGDQGLAMSASPEGEDSPIQPGYLRQGVPRIVNKPRSNDYGYSVVVLAGDSVHLPIKVQGKSVRDHGQDTQGDKDAPVNVQNQAIYRTGEAEVKIGSEERTPKKEVRVYKQHNKRPDFPVYDEDFNFAPDPFHGLLDDNYRLEVGKDKQNSVSPVESFRAVDDGVGLHRVHVRSDEETDEGNVNGEEVACGSWGKGNVTDSEVSLPLSSDGNT